MASARVSVSGGNSRLVLDGFLDFPVFGRSLWLAVRIIAIYSLSNRNRTDWRGHLLTGSLGICGLLYFRLLIRAAIGAWVRFTAT